MRHEVVLRSAVFLGAFAALAIGAGWRKRSAPVRLASPHRIGARGAPASSPDLPAPLFEDPSDRFRRAAAI